MIAIYQQGRLIERKCDADGNTIGRANKNPTLYSSHSLVNFEDGEVTELTENVIAKSIYAM